VPLYPVLPLFYLAGASLVLVMLFAYRPATTWPGLVIVAIGAAVYAAIRRVK
jgi:APA family basic amino acid/polyamine antiporter